MNKKQVMSIVKKLTVSVLAVGMIVAGIVASPKKVAAEDTATIYDKVIYVRYDAEDIETNYWTADKKTAPVKEGYVFGGWFEQVEAETDHTETYTEGDETTYYNPLTTVSGVAYAKFVPAQVLSVKAQNEAKVTKSYIDNFANEQDSFYIRVMSSLDSANYNKVGFDIYLANWLKVYKDGVEGVSTTKEATESDKIYSGVKEGTETKTAQQIFGGVSKYVSVWQLDKINYKENVELINYVRPYWETKDGTKVNGLAKYIHIEDEYLEYINVPVNLLGGEDIAAGAVNMTYTGADAGSLELVKFEEGRIFSEMKYNYSGNTVKMVGTTNLEVGKYQEEGETIYANLRFKQPTVNTEFNITDDENTFCDWNENIVDVKKVWDMKYVQTTTE